MLTWPGLAYASLGPAAVAGGIVAGAYGGSLLQGAFNALGGPSVESWKLDQRYLSWSKDPAILPPPEILFDLWIRDFITRDDLEWALKRHGISLSHHGPNKYRAQYWNKYLEGSTAFYDKDAPIYQYRLGKMTRAEAGKWLTATGVIATAKQEMLLDENEVLPLEMSLAMLNRGVMSEEYFDHQLKLSGLQLKGMPEAVKEMRKYIPTPPDLVHFAVREAWDNDVVKEFGYDEEFPEPLRYWMAKTGADWSEEIKGADGKTYPAVSWPQIQWRSHWTVISPTQAYEAFHRLRPGRIERLGPQFAGLKPFELADVRRVLKIADYPQRFRDVLAGLSYSQPMARTISKLFKTGIIDRAELKEQYRDRGYTEVDAESMTKLAEREQQLKAWHDVATDTKGKVLDEYKTGTIDRPTAGVFLYRLMIENPEYLATFQNMPLAEQRGVANGHPFVQWALEQIEQSLRADLAKRGVAGIKRRYMLGLIDDVSARKDLNILGIVDARKDDYLRTWNMDKVGRKREASASQLANWFRRGFVGYDVADQGLKELGYTDWTRGKILSFAAAEQQQDAIKQILKVAKDADSIARAQDRLLRRQHADLRAVQREALEHASETKMGRWLVSGLIRPPQMLARLLAGGYSPDDAQRSVEYYVREAEKKARESQQTPTPGPKVPRQKDTEGRLSRWFRLGIVGKKEYARRLLALGFSQGDIDKFVEENLKKRKAPDETADTTTTETTGGGDAGR